MTRHRYSILTFALALSVSTFTQAKVSEEVASRLGRDLTPLGAQMTGNADGSIPAWTGGITEPPAGYEKGMWHIDPFAGETPLFTIDAKNASQYAAHLTEGQQALFRTYPDSYKMIVYPSHRSASYPQYVYDALKRNALNAEVMPRGTGVRNAVITSPFPIPQSGIEALWNHTLRYRGEQVKFRSAFASPNRNGSYTPVLTEYEYFFTYSQPDATPESINNIIFMLRTRVLSPPKLAGTMTLVHETLDQVRSPRKAWRYETGQRRLRRSPQLAYETDLPNSESQRSVDQLDMYNGAPDQYEWTLKGKREIYIPYNAYRLHSDNTTIQEIVRPQHINQDLARYELHRVWVVEGVLREGLSHIYSKRRMYLDEDSWQIVLSEEFDNDGKLWRVSEAHLINYYEVPVPWTTLDLTYDLKNGRYFVDGLDNDQQPRDFAPELSPRDFSTSAVRRAARR